MTVALKECRTCKHWTRSNQDDETAPEGLCGNTKWRGPLWLNGKYPTFGYYPHTLQRDNCGQFKESV